MFLQVSFQSLLEYNFPKGNIITLMQILNENVKDLVNSVNEGTIKTL